MKRDSLKNRAFRKELKNALPEEKRWNTEERE